MGALLTVGVALAGCTGEATDAETQPSPSSTPAATTPTSTPTADAETDEAMLPLAVDEIGEWAATAVPQPDTATGAGPFSGWMSAHTSAHHRTDFRSLEPGTFQGQIACRGEGTITLSAGQIGAEASADPVACTNETVAFDVVTTETGASILLDLEGDPTIYAVSLQRVE